MRISMGKYNSPLRIRTSRKIYIPHRGAIYEGVRKLFVYVQFQMVSFVYERKAVFKSTLRITTREVHGRDRT